MQVLNSEQGWQCWSCKLIRSHLYDECQIGCPDLKGEIDKLLTRREATRSEEAPEIAVRGINDCDNWEF